MSWAELFWTATNCFFQRFFELREERLELLEAVEEESCVAFTSRNNFFFNGDDSDDSNDDDDAEDSLSVSDSSDEELEAPAELWDRAGDIAKAVAATPQEDWAFDEALGKLAGIFEQLHLQEVTRRSRVIF